MRIYRASPGPDGLRLIALCVVALGLSSACNNESEAPQARVTPPADSGVECGLPKAQAKPDLSKVPPQLVLGGEVRQVLPAPDLDTTLIAHEGTVEGLQDAYREAVPSAGFKVVQEDYEGFEAELYLRRGNDLGVIQLRQTGCEGTVLAYLRLPSTED